MNLPPANALRAFEAAARLSSISRAGDELHVTHAAISHHIRHLETWLGVKLFQRQGRNIALTAAGLSLSEATTDSLRQIEACCRTLLRASQASRMTIACIPSIASRWLIPGLADFQSQHPALDLQVKYAKASDRFEDIDADVLITLTPREQTRGHTARKLFSRINRPVASPHYLARTGTLKTAGEIATADLLHDETPVNWAAWFQKAGIFPIPAMRGPVFQDFNLLATAVIAGHGVALCPVEVFAREIAHGDLVVLSEIATLEDEGYFIITADRSRSELQQFVDWLMKQVPHPA